MEADVISRVNAEDFLAFREIFNSQGQAGVAAVPEPASLVPILMFGIFAFHLHLRRRG